jgi:hypothetical protein
MFTIGVDTRIDAPLPEVWEVLSDVSTYDAWNPVIRGVDGELTVGDPLTIHIAFRTGCSRSRSRSAE